MRRTLTTLAVLLAAGSVRGDDKSSGASEELKEAKEVLKRADAAVRKVELVSYSARSRSTGWLESRAPSSQGTAVLAGKGKTQQDLGKFRITVQTTAPGSSDPMELTGGSDGETFFLIDPSAKMVYEDIDPAVMGRHMRMIQGLMVRPFTLAEPFEDELKAEKVELKESLKVGDEDCYQVQVTNPEGQGEAIWFFSKKDFLPRRRDRVVINRESGEKATRELVISDLVANPKRTDNPFKANVPEGFKKTDDFAP